VKVLDFDYELPEGSIAQAPCAERDAARLLVHSKAAGETRHLRVRDLPALLEPGDLVVRNDTRVLPARLLARRASGGKVELLFLEPEPSSAPRPDPRPWRAFANPGRKLRAGELLSVAPGLDLRLLRREREPDGTPRMEWIVELVPGAGPRPVEELLAEHGDMPLPPYVRRARETEPEPGSAEGAAQRARDAERYQTIYATRPGAVAAPTAGLHFTPELFARLAERGVETTSLTLHVGPGTFRPVEVEAVDEHRMHAERFELPPQAVEAIGRARERGGRVVAVGTTSVRVLEAVAARGPLAPCAGETDLFLRPGSPFRVVDALLTNFHLPRSTLLMLVSAFAGRERVLALYREAIERRYRFYSYGDAMLVLP